MYIYIYIYIYKQNESTAEIKQQEQVVVTDPEAKAWEGWGTALKPAHEPICMARKPMKMSVAKNVQEWGTGALNIDATRVPITGEDTRSGGSDVGHGSSLLGQTYFLKALSAVDSV